MSVNLASFMNNLSTQGLANLQALAPTNLTALVQGVVGTPNAGSIGGMLEKLPAYYASNNTMGITFIEAQISSMMSGLTQAQKNTLSLVWSATAMPVSPQSEQELATAIVNARNAIGA